MFYQWTLIDVNVKQDGKTHCTCMILYILMYILFYERACVRCTFAENFSFILQMEFIRFYIAFWFLIEREACASATAMISDSLSCFFLFFVFYALIYLLYIYTLKYFYFYVTFRRRSSAAYIYLWSYLVLRVCVYMHTHTHIHT